MLLLRSPRIMPHQHRNCKQKSNRIQHRQSRLLYGHRIKINLLVQGGTNNDGDDTHREHGCFALFHSFLI